MSQGFYLSLQIGGVMSPEPVPQAVIEALTEVQVTSAATSQSGFQLKFTLGKGSDLGRRLLPSGYFAPRRRVIITVTVKGTSHVLMDGVITKQDVAPSPQAGASTLTVTGLDLTVLMDFIDLSGVIPYPAMPTSVIVLLMLAKYAAFGVAPMVIPSVITLLSNPLEGWIAHQGTDLGFINALARQAGYVFYLDPGPRPGRSTAYWGPEIRRGTPQPALGVNLDAASNAESLTFSYDGLARHQVVAILFPMEVRVPIPVPVPEITLLKPFLAEDPAAILKTRNLRVARFDAATAAQVALAAAAGPADAVTASGQVDVVRYGHVLKARKLVAVRGAGIDYDGLYFVTNVTHNIQRGKYTQSFSLARGGTKSTLQKVAS